MWKKICCPNWVVVYTNWWILERSTDAGNLIRNDFISSTNATLWQVTVNWARNKFYHYQRGKSRRCHLPFWRLMTLLPMLFSEGTRSISRIMFLLFLSHFKHKHLEALLLGRCRWIAGSTVLVWRISKQTGFTSELVLTLFIRSNLVVKILVSLVRIKSLIFGESWWLKTRHCFCFVRNEN